MRIQKECRKLKSSGVCFAYQFERDGFCGKDRLPVLAEYVLEICINEWPVTKLVCTPQYLVELVLGWMCGEGLIHGLSDIEEIIIHRQGQRADVKIVQKPEKANSVLLPVGSISWKLE